MNVAGYGQNLSLIGLQNLEELARIEREKQRLMWEGDTLQKTARAEALGGLAGTLGGVAKGYYNTKKDAHEAEQNENARQYYANDQKEYLDAGLRRGKYADPNAQYKDPGPYKKEDFDFLHAVKHDLDGLGWGE